MNPQFITRLAIAAAYSFLSEALASVVPLFSSAETFDFQEAIGAPTGLVSPKATSRSEMQLQAARWKRLDGGS